MRLISYAKNAKKAIGIFIPHLGCPNLCVFCNQNAIASAKALPTEEEIESAVVAAVKGGMPPNGFELAFFGGSFTSIQAEIMGNYLRLGKRLIDQYGLYGIRVSARPDGINEKIVEKLLKAGVTTVELGAQSMDDIVLEKCGRGHRASDTVSASSILQNVGIELVLQMMTGLPGDTAEGSLETVNRLSALKPDGVRIYPLLVLKNTPLERDYRKGSYRPQTLEEAIALCAESAKCFYEKGIPVIKLGLHANSDFRDGEWVAGPYHEAFRELVDGRIIREATERDVAGRGSLTVRCAPCDVSKAVGHKRENVLHFAKKGIRFVVLPDAALQPGDFEVDGI